MVMRPFSATLQRQFRDTLETPGAPSEIDDGQPVVAVAVVANVNTASSAGFTQITDGTDTALVSAAGRLEGDVLPAAAADYKTVQVTLNGGNQTALTATTGKTAYIVAAHLSHSANANVLIYQPNGTSTDMLRIFALANSSTNYQPSMPIQKCTSGQTLSVNGTSTAYLSITYYEI